MHLNTYTGTDWGALTLLVQDEIGGLQVYDRELDQWHDVRSTLVYGEYGLIRNRFPHILWAQALSAILGTSSQDGQTTNIEAPFIVLLRRNVVYIATASRSSIQVGILTLRPPLKLIVSRVLFFSQEIHLSQSKLLRHV